MMRATHVKQMAEVRKKEEETMSRAASSSCSRWLRA